MKKSTTTKRIITISSCIILLFALIGVAGAQEKKFPNKKITYNMCFNPGGESDITARFQEGPLKKVLGVDISIQYKIGGGGALCWADLVTSKPDGYTIAGHNLPHTVLQPLELGDPGYQTLQLKQIYFFENTPNVLMVKKDSPFKTLKEFVEYAKSQPPGVLTVGGSGTSSSNDLATAIFNKAAGIKLTYVPFGGTGSAIPALLGGHVTALMTYTPMVVQYKEKFRALGIADEKRMKVIPDVPTFKEQGYNVVEGAYRGVAAPPGTPDSVVKVLANAFKKVHDIPEVKAKMDQYAFKTEYIGPKEAEALVKKKIVEYEQLMKELGRLKKK